MAVALVFPPARRCSPERADTSSKLANPRSGAPRVAPLHHPMGSGAPSERVRPASMADARSRGSFQMISSACLCGLRRWYRLSPQVIFSGIRRSNSRCYHIGSSALIEKRNFTARSETAGKPLTKETNGSRSLALKLTKNSFKLVANDNQACTLSQSLLR